MKLIFVIYLYSMPIRCPLIFVIYFLSVLRKICARNKDDYDKNTEFRNLMRRHMALCTLPANQMVPVFQQLKQEVLRLPLRLRKQVQIMHRNYFERFWFQGIGPQLISTYGLSHKTNNVCESLHKK